MAAGEKPNGLGDATTSEGANGGNGGGHKRPVDEAKRSWAARVRFAGGDDSFAYVPNQFLVEADEANDAVTDAVVQALAPGAQRVVVEQPCEGPKVPDVAGVYSCFQYECEVL
jgi:hypothetical protein